MTSKPAKPHKIVLSGGKTVALSSSKSSPSKPAAKSKNPAVVPDELLLRPSPQHTVLVNCQGEKAGGEPGCKRQRWCKPQDAWQVKLCLPCRATKLEAKKSAGLERIKARGASKEAQREMLRSVDLRALRESAHRAAWLAVEAYRKKHGIPSNMPPKNKIKARRVWA